MKIKYMMNIISALLKKYLYNNRNNINTDLSKLWGQLSKIMKSNLGIAGIVILAIIILITASLTYSYVESIRIKPDNEISDYIQGRLINIIKIDDIEFNDQTFSLFQVSIKNKSNDTLDYTLFFYNLYPPMKNLDYKFFYDTLQKDEEQIFRIVRVEMI